MADSFLMQFCSRQRDSDVPAVHCGMCVVGSLLVDNSFCLFSSFLVLFWGIVCILGGNFKGVQHCIY